MEAALASIGSQAEATLDCVEDEVDSGRAKPIDIESLLADVIPSVLGLSGISYVLSSIFRSYSFVNHYSFPIPPRERFCLC